MSLRIWGMLAAVGIMALGFSGCESDRSDSTDQPGNPDAYRDDSSGQCSQQFTDDYNSISSIVNAATAAPSASGLDSAASELNGFDGEYQNVVCDAIQDGQWITIDVNTQVDSWQSVIASERAQFPPDCTNPFINDFDQINEALGSATTTGDLASIQVLVNNFGANYQGISCIASVSGNNETVTVSTQVQFWDSEIQTALQNMSPPAPAPVPVPAPVPAPRPPGNGTLVSAFPHGFELRIEDPTSLSAEMSADKAALGSEKIEHGQVIKSVNSAKNANFCSLISPSGQTFDHEGTPLVFSSISDSGAFLTAETSDSAYRLDCVKLDGSVPPASSQPSYTLGDLSAVFGNLAQAVRAP